MSDFDRLTDLQKELVSEFMGALEYETETYIELDAFPFIRERAATLVLTCVAAEREAGYDRRNQR